MVCQYLCTTISYNLTIISPNSSKASVEGNCQRLEWKENLAGTYVNFLIDVLARKGGSSKFIDELVSEMDQEDVFRSLCFLVLAGFYLQKGVECIKKASLYSESVTDLLKLMWFKKVGHESCLLLSCIIDVSLIVH